MITRRNVLMGASASATALLASPELQLRRALAGPAPNSNPTPNKITFPVDPVEPTATLMPTLPADKGIAALLNSPGQPLESWSMNAPTLVDHGQYEVHPFLVAVTTAYHSHYPIVFSPDMIWLLILQGFANHVNANPEKLRKKFVAHEGKILLNVRRDSFRRGARDNDWPSVFSELSAAVRPHIGAPTHDMIVTEFSTTGAVERAAMEVAMLDTLQSYFIYSMMTACGFPSVTLEGTTQDWQLLRERARQLQAFDLDWWIPSLLPVLDEFVRASQGQPDRDFWCNFYKFSFVGSGDTYIQGHIINLFPYLGYKKPDLSHVVQDFKAMLKKDPNRTEDRIRAEVASFAASIAKDKTSRFSKGTLRRNPFVGVDKLHKHQGITTGDVSAKMSCAPLTWDYFGALHQMELLAGFVGATQDTKTMAIRPEIGWAVRQAVS